MERRARAQAGQRECMSIDKVAAASYLPRSAGVIRAIEEFQQSGDLRIDLAVFLDCQVWFALFGDCEDLCSGWLALERPPRVPRQE